MDYSPPGFSVHGILQARILEWVAISFSRNIWHSILYNWASQVALLVKTCLPMQETQEMGVQSLGWEDALEEGMATHSSILVWSIPWTEEPGGL